MLSIRSASIPDLKRIVEIHNQAIQARKFIGVLTPYTVNDRKEWFNLHVDSRYFVLVADHNKAVVGWASISPYRIGREAFEQTAEISYFVDENYRKRGIGNKLVSEAIRKAKTIGMQNLLAITFHTNTASNHLLEKFGFRLWGNFPGIGKIDNRVLDHYYYGLKLNEP